MAAVVDNSPKTCTRCRKHPADPWKSVCWRCAYAIQAAN